MDKKDQNAAFMRRHVSQLKVLARLLEHELDAAKGSQDMSLDRELGESILDTLEIFIEDVDGGAEAPARERIQANTVEKATVTRLN
jgi:hypothetical protein